MRLTEYEALAANIEEKLIHFAAQRSPQVFTVDSIRQWVLDPLKALNQYERQQRQEGSVAARLAAQKRRIEKVNRLITGQ